MRHCINCLSNPRPTSASQNFMKKQEKGFKKHRSAVDLRLISTYQPALGNEIKKGGSARSRRFLSAGPLLYVTLNVSSPDTSIVLHFTPVTTPLRKRIPLNCGSTFRRESLLYFRACHMHIYHACDFAGSFSFPFIIGAWYVPLLWAARP